MSELLPTAREPRILQAPGPVKSAALAKLDQLIVIAPKKIPKALWAKLPEGSRLQKLAGRLDKDALIQGRLHNPAATGIVVARLPDTGKRNQSAFELLSFAGKLAGAALKDNPRSLGVMVAGIEPAQAEAIVRAMTLAALAHGFRMPEFRSEPETGSKLDTVRILGLDGRIDLDREIAEAGAINLARWLTVLPANKLDAKGYRDALKSLAKTNDWKMEFLGQARLERLGAGAFLAVAQGNATPDAGIVRLRYRPAGAKNKNAPLALVGKGIIFDTGGNNLKPFKAMLDMHEDMGGSAVAVATLQALTRVGYPEPVDCWLAITENRIGSRAYKSRDVVTAANGTTIEVIHTDAEGRMVLADTLALAGREEPDVIIDYATLTGTCFHALTDRYSGVFTNRDALNALLIDAGVASGERVWPFPMDDDFDTDIKSKMADVLQCSVGGDGDHILASRFLQRFVPESANWIHVDLSAVTRKDGLAQVPAGATGFGVR
ncbi:MAG: leucyl aminopeptidase family protein, partial [Gammaproteobacteria bacterium]|nr:leucyl aminopeptidase family protein [Gammaproteobacteria bacterium]